MGSAWKVSCKASIAGWSIDSADDARTEGAFNGMLKAIPV